LSTTPTTTLRLLLWPTLITLVVSVLRLVLEVQGTVSPQTGGAFHPLGITWLVFVFGAWFGWRLSRSGSAPRLGMAPLWSLLALLALVGAAMWQFGGVDRTVQTEAEFEKLRGAVLTVVAIASAVALLTFAIWTRLAFTLLLYAIPARLTVLVLTWLAKVNEWDTHYTKFGPAGIQRDLGNTLTSASLAQLGFWIPFTIVAGGLAGSLAGLLGRRRAEG
jgi:hypothetical protein